MTNINAGNTASIRLAEQSSAPTTPASGYGQLYFGADGRLRTKDSAGTVVGLTPPQFNVLDYGAKADSGTTNNTTAFNLAIAAAISSGHFGAEVVIPPPKTSGAYYACSGSLLAQSAQGLVIRSAGQAVRLHWTGNTTDPFFKLIDCRNAVLEGFQLTCTAGTPCAVGVQGYRSGASVSVVSNSNTLRRLWFDGGSTGFGRCIQIGGSGAYDANNDYWLLDTCYCINYSTYAVELTHSQSYGNLAINCAFVGSSAALAAVHISGGYFSMLGGVTADHHYAAFHNEFSSVYQGMFLKGVTSESDVKWFDWYTQGGLTVEDCRFAADVVPDTGEAALLKGGGKFFFRNNQFGDGWTHLGGGHSYYFNIQSSYSWVEFIGNTIMQPPDHHSGGTPIWLNNYQLWITDGPNVCQGNRWYCESGTYAGEQDWMGQYERPYPDGWTTIYIYRERYYSTNNTTAKTISNILPNSPLVAMQEIVLRFDDGGAANTTVAHNSVIKLVGAVNWTPAYNNTLTLRYDGAGVWREVMRSTA